MKYEDFLKKAKDVHGDKYTYQKFVELSVLKKITITCPKHGEFEQAIYAHLRGQQCPKCVGARRGYTTEDFIRDARKKHGNKFDYSKVDYKGKRNKVCIMCDELKTKDNPNGEFWQKPYTHLESKTGMPFIGNRGRKYPIITDNEKIKKKTIDFIEKLKMIFGDKYKYDNVEYKGCFQKVKINCPKHGIFEATPNNLLRGHGCPFCANIMPIPLEDFIRKAKEKHGSKYDYSKVTIKKIDDKICIICPIHGEFWQTISDHLKGKGCQMCANNKRRTTEIFIKEANKIHNNKYNYSKVEYTNNESKVCIICPEHGEFWQTPKSHLTGAGCPECMNKSHIEEEIKLLLESNKIKYEKQKRFKNIKYKKMLPFDFYLPKYNILIECQGIQHFEKNVFFKDEERFIKDEIKNKGAKENGINLLYYTNIKNYQKYFNEIYNEKNIFNDKNQILNEIKKT